MESSQFAEVENALKRAGVNGPALAGMMAMLGAIVGNDRCRATRLCRCGGVVPHLADEDLPRLSSIARQFHKDSLRRCAVVGTPIEDPSWNMMLAIYADAAEGGCTSTTSACFASGVPQTTALRHLDRLYRDGLVTKHPDPFDARRTLLCPTPAAVANMEAMIRAFCVPRPAPPTVKSV